MPVRVKNYFKVTLGSSRRYFCDEDDARDFAKQRAADPDNWDGLPFIEPINEREVITRLNELELGIVDNLIKERRCTS
jgi:hypothetical protein